MLIMPAQHVSNFYGPIIFIFAFFTVVLSAMQVGMTVNPPGNDVRNPAGWKVFEGVCRWFSIAAVILPFAVFASSLTTVLLVMVRETAFAPKHLWINRAKSKQLDAGSRV